MATVPKLTGSRQNQVNQLAAYIDATTHDAAAAQSPLTGKITYGDEFKIYAAQNSSVTAAQAYEGWVLTLVGGALPQALGAGLTAGATDVGTLAVGGAQGAAKFSQSIPGLPTFSLSVSGIAGWFFRALKVIFGGILMIVGISHLTGVDNKIVQLASKIPVIPA